MNSPRFKGALVVLAFATSLLAFGVVAFAAGRTDIKQMVIEEAQNSRVPPALALAVAKVESDFQENALSTAGARGVMQIMPKTARDEFGVDADELWQARLNIQLGIDYLERLYDQYGGRWDLALSHYNGGTLKGGKGADAKAHSYTRKYVADVLRWRSHFEDQARVWRIAKNIDNPEKWTPASIKARSVAQQLVKAKLAGDEGIGSEIRVQLRERSAGNSGIGEMQVQDRAPSVWEGSPDFDERLRRARLSLDDFAPEVRWWRG